MNPRLTLLAGALLLAAHPAQAAEPNLEDLARPGLVGDLVAAFGEICFANRNDWNAMKLAMESSRFGFELEADNGENDLDYIVFPLMGSLKEWSKTSYACLIQTQVSQDITEAGLAAQLRAAQPDLADIAFVSKDNGLSADFPEGNRPGTVFVNVADSDPLPIAQLVFIVE